MQRLTGLLLLAAVSSPVFAQELRGLPANNRGTEDSNTPYFGDGGYAGTIKPHVQLGFNVWEEFRVEPYIRFDVTSGPMLTTNVGVRSLWRVNDTLSIKQGFNLNTWNEHALGGKYQIEARFRLGEKSELVLPHVSVDIPFSGETKTQFLIMGRFMLKY